MNPVTGLVLRRRSVWEAFDSGVLLWRGSFALFIPFFAIPVWIAAFSFRFIARDFYIIPYFAIWWLKPLFDKALLHVLSRRFFSNPEPLRGKELLRGLWETIRRGLPGDLLWRRFSPYRAAHMPIRVLERTDSKQFSLRKKALARGGLSFCLLLSIICLAAEAVLLLGEIVFAIMMINIISPAALSGISGNWTSIEIFIFAAFCLNYILVESLYVCMGFGLYINSRIELEGWDLELLFRKFAARAGEKLP